MGLRGDIRYEYNCGSKKESGSDSLKDSHDEKRPKWRSNQIGHRSKGRDNGTDNHKLFFTTF